MTEHRMTIELRIAQAALFVALGAADDEIEPALKILGEHVVPKGVTEVAKVARDALTLVRMDRA